MDRSNQTPAGLETGIEHYHDRSGGELSGYLARPAGTEPLPTVVVVQEWWGLAEHIKDVTRRIARAGYVALAPDLYRGQVAEEPNEARKLVMQLDMHTAVGDIRASIAHVLGRPDVIGPKAGVIGFCMGGRLALQTVVAESRVGGAVAFYGRPLDEAEAADAQAPILGVYGSEDHSIEVGAAKAMQAALTRAGIDNELRVYEGAGHAFFNDTRAAFDADAAADAWDRMLDFFGARLPG